MLLVSCIIISFAPLYISGLDISIIHSNVFPIVQSVNTRPRLWLLVISKVECQLQISSVDSAFVYRFMEDFNFSEQFRDRRIKRYREFHDMRVTAYLLIHSLTTQFLSKFWLTSSFSGLILQHLVCTSIQPNLQYPHKFYNFLSTENCVLRPFFVLSRVKFIAWYDLEI